MNEITFNSSLIKELRSIALLNRIIDTEGLEDERYRDMRLHRIGGEGLEHLSTSSKMNSGLDFLLHLRDLGHESAENWIKANFSALGERSTFDPETLFEESFRLPCAPKCKNKGAT